MIIASDLLKKMGTHRIAYGGQLMSYVKVKYVHMSFIIL